VTRPLPEARFDHLRKLTDDRGMFEHCHGDEPRRELGYCTDDVARGLVLASSAEGEIADLGEVYLRFVVAAVAPDGQCHNRMDVDGRWTDSPALGDWWGRAVWGLGAYVAKGLGGNDAEAALERLLTRRSPYRHGTAYAALGAAPLCGRLPAARSLVADAAGSLVQISTPPESPASWRWPEPRLTYDNAAVPHALLAAGAALDREDLVELGLAQLEFLVDLQQVAGHLSVVPVGGWGPGDGPPGFDQQPIEVASLSAAGATAFATTGDERWRELVLAAARWFAGDNDQSLVMIDEGTGAGYDGLTSTGRNLNRGAESTLAALSSLMQAHR
jgi:hypothetical protein